VKYTPSTLISESQPATNNFENESNVSTPVQSLGNQEVEIIEQPTNDDIQSPTPAVSSPTSEPPTPIPPTSTPELVTNIIPVWSSEENGVRININASGVYNISYAGDAYSPWPNEQDAGYQGWTTITRIYINSPVEWGTTEYGLVGPINHDLYLGPGGYYVNKEDAIASSQGDGRTVRLNEEDYLTIVTLDEKGRYFDNRSKVDVGITFLGSQ